MSKTIERDLVQAEGVVATLRGKLKEAQANKLFRCVACKGIHKIKTCVAVQTHWYTEPYGCTGGDYWNMGELWIICPKTEVANRVLFNDHDVDYEKRKHYEWDVEEQFRRIYSPLFKSVVETHRDNPYRWINTDYFDKNRKKFGIGTPNDKR
jgi:hypothetical protein